MHIAEHNGESHIYMFISAGGLTMGESCNLLSLFATWTPLGPILQTKAASVGLNVKLLQLDALSAPRSTWEEVPHSVSSNLQKKNSRTHGQLANFLM